MSSPIGVRHLQAFIEVARCGSFTRAAGHLHLTQSALTATIKQLEQDAGLTLFDRTTRRVILSAEGERFLPVAERLVSDFTAALADLRARAQLQQGHVSVAGSPSVVTRLLPSALSQFRNQYPSIQINIRDESAGSLEQRVLNNEVDFAIAGNHSQQSELDYAPLIRDRYGLVVPSDHPLADRSSVQWREVPNSNLLLLSADTGIRAQLKRFSQSGKIPIRVDSPQIEVSNPAGMAALISQGLGITLLPALAADVHSFAGLTFIPLDEPIIEREICIITRQGRALSPAAAALLNTLRQHLGNISLPEWVCTSG
ncbi:LysR family transcriptional regulator [Marinobacterium sediminicola]|uniref:DNA-binding transcriptional regulator, LysR family n=1 Tax=Marinobacterium sediminicola TaxID=518898 RepID=A0ABY1RXD6_9GAMM|nr:LysR family transcriptional regulator [Marinobacterium sediminicola]ULG67795.1 LysR family transcriptional regulator [Marinobacterium sediminicola]SMR71529.1 DNA-binding transcriptional regulator, LysR family [Marinobacterium sediminicola]